MTEIHSALDSNCMVNLPYLPNPRCFYQILLLFGEKCVIGQNNQLQCRGGSLQGLCEAATRTTCQLQINFLFLSHFSLKLLNSEEISRGPSSCCSHRQEPGSFQKIQNNKHPTTDILNNGFTQKPQTMPSKSKYLLSPSVEDIWEGELCMCAERGGKSRFWRRQCQHLNKK